MRRIAFLNIISEFSNTCDKIALKNFLTFNKYKHVIA